MCTYCQQMKTSSALSTPLEVIREAAFTSGTNYIDALVDVSSWTGTTGQSASVGYTFARSTEGGSLFSGAIAVGAQAAMQAWSNVANISFVPTASSVARLTFSRDNLGANTAGLTTTTSVGTQTTAVEVQIDSSYSNFDEGSYAYLVMLHEMGHALGLKHPGAYGSFDSPPYLPSSTDTYQNTLMSYYEGALVGAGNPPMTPMIYDIAAAQYLYGANTSYNSTATAYFLNGETAVRTYWDGGGTDIISGKNYTGSLSGRIDLNEGVDNYSKVGLSYSWNAFGARIENAEGTKNGDQIFGNVYNNALYGRGGSDSVYGGSGNDSLYGGAGEVDPTDVADLMYGGAGSDVIIGNGGADTLIGGVAEADPTDAGDTIYGGAAGDYILGNAGNDSIFGGGAAVDPNDTADIIYGGNGSDYILGNGGNDTIYGGGAQADPTDGPDTIYGGLGNDYIISNGGADFVAGQEGNDTIYGGVGNDIFYFASLHGADVLGAFDTPGAVLGDIFQIVSNINGSGITTAAGVLSHIGYSGGNAVIDFGAGQSVTILGIAANSLTADDFTIV